MVEGEAGERGAGVTHMFTQNTAKGYRLPISINSSGLAGLDASGGWGQPEADDGKRKGQGV